MIRVYKLITEIGLHICKKHTITAVTREYIKEGVDQLKKSLKHVLSINGLAEVSNGHSRNKNILTKRDLFTNMN